MATSSITKNFVISGKEQVEMFVNAIEESAQNRPAHIPVAASEITDEAELVEFMAKCEKANVAWTVWQKGGVYGIYTVFDA